jgi:hypothetical protein
MTDAEKEAMGKSGENQDPETYEVEVNGQKTSVTLDDLRKGFMMQSDYTKKTQELSEQKKRHDALIEEKATELYMQALEESERENAGGKKDEKEENKTQDSELREKVEKLERLAFESQQATEEEKYSTMLGKTMEGLSKKYPNMDREKVMLRFYRESTETEDSQSQFEKFAKESNDENKSSRQKIIDEYLAEKTNPKHKLGEGGSSGMSGGANDKKPPKTFEEAKERALEMLS